MGSRVSPKHAFGPVNATLFITATAGLPKGDHILIIISVYIFIDKYLLNFELHSEGDCYYKAYLSF